jgi:cell division septation protein DedD
MVTDYRERKPVGKNRPKKQPVGLFVMVALATALPAFALGILAGWFLFRTDPAVFQKAVAAQVAKQVAQMPSASSAAQPGAAQPTGPVAEPSLTFYETLPKGGHAVIGSGLNPKKIEPHPSAKPPAADAPAAKPPQASTAKPGLPPQGTAPSTASPSDQSKESTGRPEGQPSRGAAKKPAAAKGTFAVQTASYQDKHEAEELKARLVAKGHAAYIVESSVPGKGTWYRVRVGKHLEDAAAKELAGKLGKSSMVIPE